MDRYLSALGNHAGVRTEKASLEEANMKGKTYYEIGGDRYDGGVVFNVYVKGKKIHSDILDGDHDFVYMKKKYNHVDKVLDAIAKDNGLKSRKDFKRVEMESYVAEDVEVLEEGMKLSVKDFSNALIKDLKDGLAMIKKNAGHDRTYLDDKDAKALAKAGNTIAKVLKDVALKS
jgi:hypothetical protein